MTVLSEEFYRMCNSPTLLNVSNDIKFVGAVGESLIMLGKTEVSIAIGDCRAPFDVYVCKNLTEPFILDLDFLQKQHCVVDYKQKVLKAGDVTLHLTKRLSPLSSFDASLVNTVKLPPFTQIIVPCKIIGHEFSDGSDVYVERNEALLGKYKIICGNGVTKTFGNSVQVRMANFTPTAKCLPMGVTAAKISVLVKISVFAKDSCVDDCAYNLETVPMNQDHSFETSFHEGADLLLLWEELKLNELNLNEGGKKAVHEIIKKHKKAFSLSKTDLGRTEVIKHSIDTGSAMPVRQQPSRMSTKQKQEVGKLVDDMLDDGVISTCKSPWSSPIVLVKKKDGIVRFCVDYRAVNNCIRKCSYPLPRIDDSLDQLSGCGYFPLWI